MNLQQNNQFQQIILHNFQDQSVKQLFISPILNPIKFKNMQPLTLQKKSSELTTWKPYKSWTVPRDLLKSMQQMQEEQLLLNLVQINLVAYYNQDVLDKINSKMTETCFYLRNRHVLQNIINVNSRDKGLNDKIKEILKKFDQIYVNGTENYKNDETQTTDSECLAKDEQQTKKMIKYNRAKQYRAKFIMRREDFMLALSQISDKLFECNQGKTEQQISYNKQQLFVEEIIELNRKIQEQDEIKSTTSVDSLQLSPDIQKTSQNLHFSKTRGYAFYFKNQYQEVSQILLDQSTFIKTKNRSPLKLDFGFSKFIYKNDDQLSHQIIAMQFIKYLNKIFGKKYIQEYEIIPQIKGALYQFVEDSLTIAQIKKEHKDLVQYFKFLSEKKGISLISLQRKFAESYAGYCIAQFLLEIKDRNNANIMLKDDGTFFHIDLAFIFNAKPGGISFESAPFKMTKQYIKAMGGFSSDNFKYFESLLIQLTTKIFESKQQFLYKLQILGARSKQIRCFNGFEIQKYKETKIVKNLDKVREFVEDLIDKSNDSWCTKKYDDYQFKVNKIPK